MKKTALVVAFLGFASFAHAGATRTDEWHMPQGSGAGTANGDYVTASPGGFNGVYRYFIEVPPSQTRLHIELFDPDIGLGGAGEAGDGRDRQRGGSWNTTATYSLFNPSGVAQTVQFTSGNVAGPGNDAWVTYFDTNINGGGTYSDNFNPANYTGNDGTLNWTAGWDEVGDDDDPAAGTILISGGRLRMRPVGSGDYILRQADLNGATSATLTFDYDTDATEANDVMLLQVSTNGGAWTTVETFTGSVNGTHNENILAFAHTNTRFRFMRSGGYTNADETFWFDNVVLTYVIDTPSPAAGHWELQVGLAGGGDDINAFGLRAHDGNNGAGGTEFNVYADSMVSLGINPGPNGEHMSRTYNLHPWVTSGCTCVQNDFDRDTNNADSGNTGSVTWSKAYATPGTGTFTQTFTSATLSGDNAWNDDPVTGWNSSQDNIAYGLWTWQPAITTYDNDQGRNGNYETAYVGTSAVDANPPSANPEANTFRVYLPNDAGAAPAKPYLLQMVRHNRSFTGTSIVQPGVTSTFTVTIRLVNPTAQSIQFSTPANIVRATVPASTGTIVRYGGNAFASHGLITGEPTINMTGDITWNPQNLAAGATAILYYDVRVTPTAGSTTTIPVTGTPGSNGTRAQYVDETGNAAQGRAINLLGDLCGMSVSRNLATPVLFSSFDTESHGGTTTVRWDTASEAGTIGFNLYRANGEKVNHSLIPASLKPHGGRYEVVDSGNPDAGAGYVVEEITSSGVTRSHGPMLRVEGVDREVMRRRSEGRSRMALTAVPADAVPANAAGEKIAAVMVGVRDTGIVRVPAADLAAAFGEKEKTITRALEKGQLAVTFQDSPVSWVSEGQNLYFFGQKSTSIYSNEHVYRVDLTSGSPMKVANWTPATAPVSSFLASHEVETDAFAATVLPIDPAGDYYFWDYVISGDPADGRKTFTVNVPSLASASGASLEVRLQGALKDAAHSARIVLNGVPIGDASWKSFDAKTAKLNIPAAVLREGANEVAVEGILAAGASFDVFYVDGFTVKYQKSAKPEAGQLELRATGTVSAGPFAVAPMILDISNALRPVIVQGATFQGGISSVNVPSNRTLFFSESFVTPSSLRGSPEVKVKGKLRADWLIIAPRSMRTAAEPLARLRDRENLDTMVVELEQVYDAFAGGNVTPIAIRDFIRFTRTWNQAPRYIVLAGLGTIDYRGIQNPPGPMPPLLTSTPDGLYAADSLYTDFNGDGLPDVAIGRIPVRTAAELSAYVAKLDANARISTATSPIVFSADAADNGASFREASVLAEAPLLERPATRVYVDDLGGDGARTAMIDAWQAGSPLVSWVGHGGLDRISSGGVLTSYDASLLESAGRLPVLVAMTCTINRFENGYVDPLGTALTNEAGAGALAVWSASGLSQHSQAGELQRTFLQLASQALPGKRLGDLIVSALASHKSDTASIYLLLGDPAIRLDLPREVTTGGNRPGNRKRE